LEKPIPDKVFPHHNTTSLHQNEAWDSRLNRAVEKIEATIPKGLPFILVEEQEFGHLLIRGYKPIPFLERNGIWWGILRTARRESRSLSCCARVVQYTSYSYGRPSGGSITTLTLSSTLA
jgi:hypothetical protein